MSAANLPVDSPLSESIRALDARIKVLENTLEAYRSTLVFYKQQLTFAESLQKPRECGPTEGYIFKYE